MGASTASILVVAVSLVDNITTEPTWTSTIPVTLERSVCDTSTSRATTSGSLLSTWKLWSLIPAEKRDEYLVSKKGDTIPVLDLLPLGYSKVLGKGRLPEVPLVVRARWFSKEAERKITEAGGVVELVA